MVSLFDFLLILRNTSYGNLEKLDFLCALIFSGLQVVLNVANQH